MVDGRYRLTYEPEQLLPIEEWLRPQKRFAHLFRPGNEALLEEIQQRVEAEWQALCRRCEAGVPE